ncbi:Protein of unknown function [Cotesia congregata]|uniref:Uncharacterized protein n=1 Tax=Cotesia congregata TaxID=51543 RepID=A0A8J2EAB3_COTCN|nr:Protein of unknown function [Cotesia congregata]
MPYLSSGDSTYGGVSDDPSTEIERNNRESRDNNRETGMDVDESSDNEDADEEPDLQTDADDSKDDRQSLRRERLSADNENPERPPRNNRAATTPHTREIAPNVRET